MTSMAAYDENFTTSNGLRPGSVADVFKGEL